MKNVIITSTIIASMILSSATAFATGNECRKEKKNCSKPKSELLKFSVNDFVGREDSQNERIELLESMDHEKSEKVSGQKESPVKKSAN